MTEDAAARALLNGVVVEWTDSSVLGVLRSIIDTVWKTNSDRHEHRLGDDAMTLGVQSSRNVCNLAVKALQGMEGVSARDLQTLEVGHLGRVLHIGKARSQSRSWNVNSIDWSQSEVRTTCADDNTRAYMPVDGSLFTALPGQPADPTALVQLHLTWQGFADGSTRAWFGFPRSGTDPWFAVVDLGVNGGGRGGVRPEGAGLVPPSGDFDTLGEPDLQLARRADDGASRRPRGA